MARDSPQAAQGTTWDHSADQHFVDYYEAESVKPETVQRFRRIRDKALSLLARSRAMIAESICVADIGCGTGTQSRLWAEQGHRVYGLDINEALVDIARRRAQQVGLDIRFEVRSATELPYPDASMDVVLMPELLEHVAAWQCCLEEAVRVLKPAGVLYLSTTNWLCPVQQEFNLPMYSWYPPFLKHHYEHLAVTTRPELANYCKYPAVNWFSVYSLSRYLKQWGFASHDRFDMLDVGNRGIPIQIALRLIRAFPPLRFIGHVLTPATSIYAIRSQTPSKGTAEKTSTGSGRTKSG